MAANIGGKISNIRAFEKDKLAALQIKKTEKQLIDESIKDTRIISKYSN
jgi:hypothetical protein